MKKKLRKNYRRLRSADGGQAIMVGGNTIGPYLPDIEVSNRELIGTGTVRSTWYPN